MVLLLFWLNSVGKGFGAFFPLITPGKIPRQNIGGLAFNFAEQGMVSHRYFGI